MSGSLNSNMKINAVILMNINEEHPLPCILNPSVCTELKSQ